MILVCTSTYRNRGVAYRAGEIITVPDAEGRALLADSPGSFALPEDHDPARVVPTPLMDGTAPANTAITRVPKRKG